MKVAILGAGAWGTAMAAHLAPRHDTLLWARDAELLAKLAETHENTSYLPGCALPPALSFTADLSAALAHGVADDALCVIATPVAGLRGLCAAMVEADAVPRHLIWLCKGFESDTHQLPHQIVNDVIGEHSSCGTLSGPSFAREVARGLPAALTVASAAASCRERTVQAFHHGPLRIYTCEDLTGVETGAAVKNVLAIAIGIADGLSLGLNARAALITRGLAEMTRLGVALGAVADTFTGLTGLGDLVLTATGDLSRNRQVGMRLAGGEALPAILADLGHVAEGVLCASAVRALARDYRVEMPIAESVCQVLFEGRLPSVAVKSLLSREAKSEFGETPGVGAA
ncbi:MAG: NAD(P)H-dependent glycerol-3-phosphate dehydrogenase [Janthinobacterium lividum]